MLVKGAPGIHAIPLSKGNNYHQHLPYVRLLLITERPGHANKVVRHLCGIPARSARAAVAPQIEFPEGTDHWGSSHEGSGCHPRQHGGGRGRRFGKFTANSHRVCSFLRPSFCELIVIGVGHIDAEARAAVIRYLATIPV